MPFQTSVQSTHDLMVTTAIEPATDEDLESLVAELTARADFNPHFDRLVNLRALQRRFFLTAAARVFVETARHVADLFLACGKTAIVVSVYEARDPRLKRTVAIKLLPPDLTKDDTTKQRFLQEAKATSALDHPNVWAIHEINFRTRVLHV